MPDADFREHTFQRLSEKSKCACELPLMRLSKASFRAVSAALGRVRTPAAYRRSLFQTVSPRASVNKVGTGKAGIAQDPEHKTQVRYSSSKFETTKQAELRFRALLTRGASDVELSLV